MKTCILCSTQFKIRAFIDGRIRNLNKRKYCLSCSPWKKHNTRQLQSPFEDQIPKSKLCRRCSTEKSKDDFYRRRKGSALSSYCIACTAIEKSERVLRLKQKAVTYKGGKCVICAYDRYLGALQFHHKDPTQKSFNISECRCTTFEKIIPELDKCVLLCSRCHDEVEGGIAELPSLI